jgi:hypothetical protein
VKELEMPLFKGRRDRPGLLGKIRERREERGDRREDRRDDRQDHREDRRGFRRRGRGLLR